jgi:hypothetical protein
MTKKTLSLWIKKRAGDKARGVPPLADRLGPQSHSRELRDRAFTPALLCPPD